MSIKARTLSLKYPILMTCSLMIFASCTLGPRVKTETIIVRAGRPLLITENVTVKGQIAGSDEQVHQDIGGWIALPEDHWDALMRALDKKAD